jgi:hypothetical protein
LEGREFANAPPLPLTGPSAAVMAREKPEKEFVMMLAVFAFRETSVAMIAKTVIPEKIEMISLRAPSMTFTPFVYSVKDRTEFRLDDFQ